MALVGTHARTEMIRLASQLLVGPMLVDEVLASAPADTYLTGILWPEGQTIDASEDDEDLGASSDQDSGFDSAVPGYRSQKPCSFGLTFAARLDAVVQISLGETARYAPHESVEVYAGGVSRRNREWKRVELGYTYVISPGPAETWFTEEYKDFQGQTVLDNTVRLHIRRRLTPSCQVITVTLINKTPEADNRHRDELCLFQTGISLTALEQSDKGAIIMRPAAFLAGADEDAQSAALLYRHVVEYAVGHGIAVIWESDEYGQVNSLRTSWMPLTHLKNMSAEGHETIQSFLKAEPNLMKAAWLSETSNRADVVAAFRGFADCYSQWIDSLNQRKSDFSGQLRTAADRNIERCRTVAERILEGVRELEVSDNAWIAFNLANKAMDDQAAFEAKGQRRGPLVWRPFQIAYILMVLKSLSDPTDKYRDTVDLLWFPTGGGKTEAYLGLTAFQIFHRRLTSLERRSSGGVDVMMRYTLRLLTVQQFQRAASLICACDLIRASRTDLGDARVSIGLYVGGEATPNRSAKAFEALRDEHDGRKPSPTPCQLLSCPVCSRDLPVTAYSESQDGSGIDIRCPNDTCPTQGTTLPVLTVDDFMYSSPPSLVIGTVDKFAQLPRRSDLRTLFGLDGELRPGLIIQDELHLISGPLGSVAGLYETVIDMLCTETKTRAKVIGSTATIGQAARQIRALFDRDVLQFPPSGFESFDSFFAVQDNVGSDRVYVGLSTAGRSPKFALQAVAAAVLQTASYLAANGCPDSELDPYWTSVLYFNSLRELGGAHVLVQDDVPRQLSFLASRLNMPPRPLQGGALELSSRVSSRELPGNLKMLGEALGGNDPFAEQPQDVVLASNMISVGVDVPRLGLMLVNGQPKSTAEYIQASSRVGRGIPGLIFTLYNFGRPRDVSHFEHFLAYHGAIYKSVEATSVTPWAPRARDKALHAVVAAAVRHLVQNMEDDDAAVDFDAALPTVKALINAIERRADSSSSGIEAVAAAADLAAIVREWSQRSSDSRAAGTELIYWERKAPFGKTRPHLMASAEDGARPGKLAWPTPNSMREVEPSTAFALKVIRRS
jgi:hypothetical protein